jgi:hypothetical protein
MRIIVFILIGVIQLAATAAGFVILLLSMNGYSERDATPGISLYIVLGLISALGLGIAGAFAAKRLVEKKSLGGLAASTIAVSGFSFLGALILAASFFAAIVFAEIVRGMR